jgi:hypothetical protein
MDKENGEGLTLWSGIVAIRQGSLQGTFPCRVSFDLNRDNTLDFGISGALYVMGQSFSFESPIFIRFADVKEEVECHAKSHKLTWHPDDDSAVLGPRFSRVHVDSGSKMRVVHAGIVNLAPFHFVGPGQGNVCNLKTGEWAVEIVPISGTLEYPRDIQSEQYHFTHQGSLSRLDGDPFSASEARSHLEDLCKFLSFCSGRWVSTALAYGIGCDGELAYQEWGTGQVSPMGAADGWLDLYHAAEMQNFFPTFISLFRSSSQSETVNHALYWYIRAHTNLIGPDGACILLQTALERIAWQILVNDRHALSPKGFSDLAAADQLRLLFTYLSIPLSVPTELEELCKLTHGRGLDGPEILTFIRNKLVHPPKLNSKQERYPYYQAYTLAKWYLELSLLKLGGFCGKYQNRTRKERWRGQVENVPWAQ